MLGYYKTLFQSDDNNNKKIFFCLRPFWWPANKAQEMEFSWSTNSLSEMRQFASWWGQDLHLDFQVQSRDNNSLLRKRVLGSSARGRMGRRRGRKRAVYQMMPPLPWWYKGPQVNSSRWWLHDFQTPWAGCSCPEMIRSFPLKTQPPGVSVALLTSPCLAPA